MQHHYRLLTVKVHGKRAEQTYDQMVRASPRKELDAEPIEPIPAFLFCIQLEDPNNRR